MTNETAPRRRWIGWACAGLLLALSLVFLEHALFPPLGHIMGGQDASWQFATWAAFARQELSEGRLPLWDPYHFSGYPFLSNPQVGFFYPPTWLAILLPLNLGISLYVALHVWLAGVGMLLFVRRMRGSWLGALLAAIAFSFSGFVSARIWGGHFAFLAVHVWTPWMLLALAWSVQRGDIWSAIVAGLPIAFAILAGHTTSLVYVGLIWLAFAIYLVVTGGGGLSEDTAPGQSDKGLKPPARQRLLVVRQGIISVLMGLTLSMVQLLPLIQLAALSTRAAGTMEEFGYLGAMPPVHLITLLIPDYFGEPIRAGYWSVPNFTELTYYVGTLPVLGLILALRKPTRLTWLYVGLAVFGLMLALGGYGFLYRVLYDWLPPFRMMRAPGRAGFLYTFAASALLGEAVSAWTSTPTPSLPRPTGEGEASGAHQRRSNEALSTLMRWLLIIVAVVGVAGLAATGAAFVVEHPSDTSGRLWHQVGGWSIALVSMLVGGALLWGYLGMGTVGTRHAVSLPSDSSKRKQTGLAAGLVIVLVADLWLLGFKMVRLESMVPAPIWTEAASVIGETDQRVLPWGISTFDQNGAGQVGLHSVFGYNPLEIAAHQSFAASVADPRSTAYDILGVGYVIAGGPLDESTQGERPLTLVSSGDSSWVYRRAQVMPIARLTYEVEVIADPAGATARVHEPGFDPAAIAIVDETPPCEAGPAPETPGTATIVTERPGYWRIATESDAPALLVLAETAYPGWRVTVDGDSAASLTAYTTLRAVCVPPGAHEVEWVYDPSAHKIGAAISVAGWLLAAAAGFIIWRGRNPGRKRDGHMESQNKSA